MEEYCRTGGAVKVRSTGVKQSSSVVLIEDDLCEMSLWWGTLARRDLQNFHLNH
jgi:hypothetical protein